MNLIRISL